MYRIKIQILIKKTMENIIHRIWVERVHCDIYPNLLENKIADDMETICSNNNIEL